MKKKVIVLLSVFVLLGTSSSAFAIPWYAFLFADNQSNLSMIDTVENKVSRLNSLYVVAKTNKESAALVLLLEDRAQSILETFFTLNDEVNDGVLNIDNTVSVLFSKYQQCKLTIECGLRADLTAKQFIKALNKGIKPIVTALKKKNIE